MYSETVEVAKRVKDGRTVRDVMEFLVSEVGELSDEIAIKYGISNKEPGKDGVFGEAVDVIAAALDLIFVDDPTKTEEDVVDYLRLKLQKWENTRG
jgi:hypothetical protein